MSKKTFCPRITEYLVETKKTEDKKIVLIADLHGCDNKPVAYLINEWCPDYIMIAGDLVHSMNNYLPGIEFLKEIKDIAPIYMSVGNHEKRCSESVLDDIKKEGAILLDDSFIIDGDMVIGGLSTGFPYGYRGRKTPPPVTDWLDSFISTDGYRILLNHHPEYYDRYLKEKDIDLILSGHAHGGQWRFFNQGIYSPGQGIFPKYTSGIFDGKMIVTRGLGNPHFIPRINNSPEICIINIKKTDPKI